MPENPKKEMVQWTALSTCHRIYWNLIHVHVHILLKILWQNNF
jgi:hypothetical protein